MKTKAIIFDFDGVLVESVDVKTRAFADMYARYGDDVVRQVIDYHLANGGVSRLKKFRYFHEVILKNPLSLQEEKALGETFSNLVKDAVINAPWVPGAFEFLSEFYKKIPLFVASGTPDEEIREIVECKGMNHFFVSVHGTPSTKKDIINRICNTYEFDCITVMMVGDAITDYDGARSAGVRFVGRCSKGRGPFPPDVEVIKDLKRLYEFCE